MAGIGALAKCALLLLGVPLAVARLWTLAPGPSVLARPESWLDRATVDHAVLGVVGALWAVAAASLVRDVARVLRGRLVAPQSSWSARWASRVAGLLLLISTGSAIAATGAAATARASHQVPVVAARPVDAGTRPPDPHPGTDRSGPAVAAGGATSRRDRTATRSYVVRAGDCLASIAARELGDASEWTVLSRLNMGRVQPDGRRMVDPSLIYPGWVLVVPAFASGEPLVSGPSSAPRPATARDTAPRPGGSLRPAGRAVLRHPAPSARGPRASGHVMAGPEAHHAVDTPTGEPVRALAELAILGLGVLTTASIARRLRASRRAAECLRMPGERAVGRPGATAAAAASIDPLAESALLDWVDGANRLLWRACRDRRTSSELPVVRLVRAGPGGVQCVLEKPMPAAPEGFVATGGGREWTLAPGLDLDELAALTAGCGRYVPTLVPLGDAADASYLAAVGPGHHVTLLPDGGDAVRALDALVVALRTLPWAHEVQVELLGVAPPPVSHGCHFVARTTGAELAEIARAPLPDPRQRLEDAWSDDVVVVLGDEATHELPEHVLAAVGERAGIVSIGGPGAVSLVVRQDRLVILPDGVELDRREPTPSQAALAEDLLELPVLVAAPEPPDAVARAAAPAARATRAGRVEVRVLAPVPSLDGLTVQPSSKDHGRVVELVAYLALSGHVATTDSIREQVFGRSDRVASLGRVHNVCSAARAALGSTIDGRSLLPAGAGGRYRLDSEVSCDWLRFESMRSEARVAAVPDAIALLGDALRLVDGAPCADVASGWDWLISRGLLTSMISAIVDAGHHLASLSIAGHDLELASWAVAKGRLAEPCSEMLARDAMIVADLRSDPDTVRREWRDLERGLARLDGDEPSAETRALYEELVAGRTGTAARYRSARNG